MGVCVCERERERERERARKRESIFDWYLPKLLLQLRFVITIQIISSFVMSSGSG